MSGEIKKIKGFLANATTRRGNKNPEGLLKWMMESQENYHFALSFDSDGRDDSGKKYFTGKNSPALFKEVLSYATGIKGLVSSITNDLINLAGIEAALNHTKSYYRAVFSEELQKVVVGKPKFAKLCLTSLQFMASADDALIASVLQTYLAFELNAREKQSVIDALATQLIQRNDLDTIKSVLKSLPRDDSPTSFRSLLKRKLLTDLGGTAGTTVVTTNDVVAQWQTVNTGKSSDFFENNPFKPSLSKEEIAQNLAQGEMIRKQSSLKSAMMELGKSSVNETTVIQLLDGAGEQFNEAQIVANINQVSPQPPMQDRKWSDQSLDNLANVLLSVGIENYKVFWSSPLTGNSMYTLSDRVRLVEYLLMHCHELQRRKQPISTEVTHFIATQLDLIQDDYDATQKKTTGDVATIGVWPEILKGLQRLTRTDNFIMIRNLPGDIKNKNFIYGKLFNTDPVRVYNLLLDNGLQDTWIGYINKDNQMMKQLMNLEQKYVGYKQITQADRAYILDPMGDHQFERKHKKEHQGKTGAAWFFDYFPSKAERLAHYYPDQPIRNFFRLLFVPKVALPTPASRVTDKKEVLPAELSATNPQSPYYEQESYTADGNFEEMHKTTRQDKTGAAWFFDYFPSKLERLKHYYEGQSIRNAFRLLFVPKGFFPTPASRAEEKPIFPEALVVDVPASYYEQLPPDTDNDGSVMASRKQQQALQQSEAMNNGSSKKAFMRVPSNDLDDVLTRGEQNAENSKGKPKKIVAEVLPHLADYNSKLHMDDDATHKDTVVQGIQTVEELVELYRSLNDTDVHKIKKTTQKDRFISDRVFRENQLSDMYRFLSQGNDKGELIQFMKRLNPSDLAGFVTTVDRKGGVIIKSDLKQIFDIGEPEDLENLKIVARHLCEAYGTSLDEKAAFKALVEKSLGIELSEPVVVDFRKNSANGSEQFDDTADMVNALSCKPNAPFPVVDTALKQYREQKDEAESKDEIVWDLDSTQLMEFYNCLKDDEKTGFVTERQFKPHQLRNMFELMSSKVNMITLEKQLVVYNFVLKLQPDQLLDCYENALNNGQVIFLGRLKKIFPNNKDNQDELIVVLKSLGAEVAPQEKARFGRLVEQVFEKNSYVSNRVLPSPVTVSEVVSEKSL